MEYSSMQRSLARNKYPFLLLLSGFLGLTASFALSLEKIRILEDPVLTPSCSLNPIITCAAAMSSAQATTFGIPNSMIGIAFYTLLIAMAGLLMTSSLLSKRIWAAVAFIAVTGFIFTNYLILQSVLVLHVICPWCFVIWISAPLIIWSLVKIYTQKSQAHSPRRSHRLVQSTNKHLPTFTILWYVYLLLLLLFTFWEYWVTLL